MSVTFLIWAPRYQHSSSGIRALYRLCHHLNTAGYRAAMLIRPLDDGAGGVPVTAMTWRSRVVAMARLPRRIAGRVWRRVTGRDVHRHGDIPRDWRAPVHHGRVGRSIVIYPEVVPGNPFAAEKVIRWVLNVPGLLGGDTAYADDELVFCYDPQRLDDVNRAVSQPIGAERVLWLGLVDPAHIYPDPSVPKTMDCSFTHKGRALRARFPLPEGVSAVAQEALTPNMAALGDTLRRTRTLYSYDHYSNVLREAVICGCDVRVVSADGRWHDPRGCDCVSNILWPNGFETAYRAQFQSNSFVPGFIREVRRCWDVPEPNAPAARLVARALSFVRLCCARLSRNGLCGNRM